MAGTEFLSNEQPEKAKLNQKTTYVSIGSDIDALGTTYPGQLAYSTNTSGTKIADTLYVRNAANSAWVTVTTATTGITAGTETEFTGPADDTNHDMATGTRYYAFYTLPTTEPFYVITEISWKTGTPGNAGNILCGVDAINAIPPTLGPAPLLALGAEIAMGAASSTIRNTVIASSIIPGGTKIAVWVHASSATADLRRLNVGTSQVQTKTIAYPTTVYNLDSTAWDGATTQKVYITCKYKGFY